jgi:hypothetical protein
MFGTTSSKLMMLPEHITLFHSGQQNVANMIKQFNKSKVKNNRQDFQIGDIVRIKKSGKMGKKEKTSIGLYGKKGRSHRGIIFKSIYSYDFQ